MHHVSIIWKWTNALGVAIVAGIIYFVFIQGSVFRYFDFYYGAVPWYVVNYTRDGGRWQFAYRGQFLFYLWLIPVVFGAFLSGWITWRWIMHADTVRSELPSHKRALAHPLRCNLGWLAALVTLLISLQLCRELFDVTNWYLREVWYKPEWRLLDFPVVYQTRLMGWVLLSTLFFLICIVARHGLPVARTAWLIGVIYWTACCLLAIFAFDIMAWMRS